MSARFDLSHILHPAGLSPRPEGLRVVTPLGADEATPKPTHTLPNFNPARRAPPVQNPSPAPAGEGQGRGPGRLTPPTRKAKPMPASPNQDAVLAALDKQSPIARETLKKQLKNMTQAVFDQTTHILAKQGRIVKGGTRTDRQYGLPGTKFLPAAKPAPTAKAKAAKAVKTERRNGHTSTVTPLTVRPGGFMLDRPPEITEVTALPCRAMKLANGGAIVLQGASLVAELTAAQLDVVRQL